MVTSRAKSRVACLLLVAAAALSGCGGGGDGDSGGGSETAASAGEAVTIVDFTYEPKTITVPPGTEVEFTNRDASPHTATSTTEPEALDTGTIKKGQTGSIRFEQPGSFAFHCLFHPFMKGKVVVE